MSVSHGVGFHTKTNVVPPELQKDPIPQAISRGVPRSQSWPSRRVMDNSRHLQQSGPAAPSMRGQLGRSFPSSYSIASTASPGSSTPNSWSAHEWLRGSPNTSPPSSGVGSPELKAKLLLEDGNVSPVEQPLDNFAVSAAKNICFVGAGFVGMIKPVNPLVMDSLTTIRGAHRCRDCVP